MIGRLCLVAVCTLQLSSAFLFWGRKWNGLKVTFGINPFNSNYFAELPRTKDEADQKGWAKISDCFDQSSKFKGNRYVKDNDYAVVLLYDVNGYIAGIQTGIAKSGSFPPAKQRGNIFQDDGEHYTLTAYFIDPARICSGGRTAAEFSAEGTGTGLYIQNGSNPLTDLIIVPTREPGVGKTTWTKGYCFPAMGMHYWYNITLDMSCDDFLPVFTLYNRHRLTAFGWVLLANETSPRFEHPKHSVIEDDVSANLLPVCATPHQSGTSQKGDCRSMPQSLRTNPMRRRGPEVRASSFLRRLTTWSLQNWFIRSSRFQ